MRDFIILLIVFGSLPFCLARPALGILVWSWIEYMNPQRLTFGIAYHFPVGNIVAIATMCGVVFGKGEKRLAWGRETLLLLLLFGMFTISSVFAFYPEEAWKQWIEVSKVLALAVMTIFLIHDEKTLRWLYLVIALSLGFYGFKAGIFSVLTGGQFMVWGPSRSYIEANTMLGLALDMVLPLLWYLSKNEQNYLFKRFIQAVFFASILSVLFTYSRGAFLGLCVVIIFLILKSGKMVRLGITAVILVSVVYFYAPDRLIDRQKTIATYEEDRSAESRLLAWEYAWNVGMDRPLSGGGFKVYSEETYQRYLPRMLDEFGQWWNAHSIYFGVLAEHGFIALFFFLGLIASSLLTLRGVKNTIRGIPGKESLYNYCQMIEISLYSYLISGAFLDAHYFSLLYQLVGTVVILKTIVQKSTLQFAPLMPEQVQVKSEKIAS